MTQVVGIDFIEKFPMLRIRDFCAAGSARSYTDTLGGMLTNCKAAGPRLVYVGCIVWAALASSIAIKLRNG